MENPKNKDTDTASTPSKKSLAIFATTILVGVIGYFTWGYIMVREPDLIYKVTGRYEEVITLLEQGADPNQRFQNGVTALMHALEAQHNSKILIALLEAGADPSQKSKFIWGRQLMDWLYPRVRVPAESSEWEHTPLIVAIKFQSPEVAELMIEKGANVNPEKANDIEQSPLVEAINSRSQNENYDLIERLINMGAHVAPDIIAQSNALRSGNVKLLSLLIDNGADVNAKEGPPLFYTALYSAAVVGSVEEIQFLLDHGADPTISSMKGQTPLQRVEADILRTQENGTYTRRPDLRVIDMAKLRLLQEATSK